ncbi:SDR family NAD(P)-dependent oxidoreductase [Croceicoccus sediminis]|uniref:SDR family NAD(P)-dependent oxidoreductase n=1 Tax=Croceicoccus sediminis TaxID=2571150 RepID=UPI00118431E3|nr:glucose 1-dehydrogenase [Croceicoccus sediminis]
MTKINADLHGKVALVTGASSGLGAHFATVLAKAGAKVFIGARRIEALAALAQDINDAGGRAEAISLDVTNPASIESISDAVSQVDILVNNAGITRESAMLDMSEDDWDAVVDTNAKGVFLMTQAVARAMKARGTGGSIINIGSILGIRQGGMVSTYAASKAAALQLTKVSALELARYGIRVNAIAPGYFKTEMNAEFFESSAGQAMVKRISMRRLGNLDDLDGPLLLLASDSSQYMTGSVIEVDGGHLLSTL